jgi:hypothetical protein
LTNLKDVNLLTVLEKVDSTWSVQR